MNIILDEANAKDLNYIMVKDITIEETDYEEVGVFVNETNVVIREGDEDEYTYIVYPGKFLDLVVSYTVYSSEDSSDTEEEEQEDEEPDPTQEELEKGIPEPSDSPDVVAPEKKKWGFFG